MWLSLPRYRNKAELVSAANNCIHSVVGIAASVLGTVHRIATSFITWMHNLH